jgi:kynurenine formamidase
LGTRPRYDSLPDRRVVGLHGPDEQRGCLNALTPERVRAAAALILTGETFGLNNPIDYPSPHPSGEARTPPTHVVKRDGIARDDYLDRFFPQFGSQWDGFLHIHDDVHGCYYNANTDESRGIDAWAALGIAGRGVLLDVARHRARLGRPIDWRARDVVTIDDLRACAGEQGVEITDGTILLIRFGWEAGWRAAGPQERAALAGEEFRCPGLEAAPSTVAALWDWGVAAVAADNYAFEPFPIEEYFMHVDLLTRAGMPIGELWGLEALSEACARQARYEFFLTSAPLNVPGGIGSTANALAIL